MTSPPPAAQIWQVVNREIDVNDDLFLIIASDGVWEFIDNERAVCIVEECYSCGMTARQACSKLLAYSYSSTRRPPPHVAPSLLWQACGKLIAYSALEWKNYEGDDYRDDITAVVVYLPSVVATLEVNALATRTRASVSVSVGGSGDRATRAAAGTVSTRAGSARTPYSGASEVH